MYFFYIFIFDSGNEQIISLTHVVSINFIVVCVGNIIEPPHQCKQYIYIIYMYINVYMSTYKFFSHNFVHD